MRTKDKYKMALFSKHTTLLSYKSFPIILALLLSIACGEGAKKAESESMEAKTTDIAEIKVPEGFGVTRVADSLGKPRHLAVTPSGGIYVKLRQPVNGNGILYLTDTDGDGVTDTKEGFG
ncbi:MAG: hypothetical protein HKN31_02075, partial [Pricia sp.]|nr:hypothetical protein [Pricia sp.]